MASYIINYTVNWTLESVPVVALTILLLETVRESVGLFCFVARVHRLRFQYCCIGNINYREPCDRSCRGFYGPISSPFVLNSCGQQSLKKKTTENLTLP